MRLHLSGVSQWGEKAFASYDVDIEVLNGF